MYSYYNTVRERQSFILYTRLLYRWKKFQLRRSISDFFTIFQQTALKFFHVLLRVVSWCKKNFSSVRPFLIFLQFFKNRVHSHLNTQWCVASSASEDFNIPALCEVGRGPIRPNPNYSSPFVNVIIFVCLFTGEVRRKYEKRKSRRKKWVSMHAVLWRKGCYSIFDIRSFDEIQTKFYIILDRHIHA